MNDIIFVENTNQIFPAVPELCRSDSICVIKSGVVWTRPQVKCSEMM